MNTTRKGESFWIDTLTQANWRTKKEIPKNIPECRLEHWDSKMEYFFYQRCLHIPGARISRQVPILLLKEIYPFPELSWKIDFVINDLYIEIKGGWIDNEPQMNADFIKTLRLFQSAHPIEFYNFILVGSRHGKLGNTSLPIVTADEAIRRIKECC